MRPSGRGAGTTRPGRSLPETAHMFAALGDETRLRLVSHLCRDGPLSITKLAAGAQISRQAITKHLRTMETAGLVQSLRSGREIIWRMDQARLEEARRYLDQISSQWEAALERLRTLVEKEPQS
jgi:DNA-binding transcriptional ArsR family regulator